MNFKTSKLKIIISSILGSITGITLAIYGLKVLGPYCDYIFDNVDRDQLCGHLGPEAFTMKVILLSIAIILFSTILLYSLASLAEKKT